MNATQHKSPGRCAHLSHFDVEVTTETPTSSPRVRNAVGGEIRKGEAETDSRHGCVDWYRYRGVGRTGPEQQIEEPRTAGTCSPERRHNAVTTVEYLAQCCSRPFESRLPAIQARGGIRPTVCCPFSRLE
jgi:hypothetical protein